MANTVLNPAVVTAQGNQMPTFSQTASVQYPTGLSFPSSSLNPSLTPMNKTQISGGDAIGGSVAGILGFINGFLDRKQEKELANQQMDWNSQMLDKQNQWNLDMWNMTNAYNTPSAQVQRLQDAGLNVLNYGLDGSSASSMQSAQALGYDRASMRGLANPIQAGLDSALKFAQEKVALSSARRNESESDLADARTISESLMRNRAYDLLGVQIELTGENANLTRSQVNKVSAEISQIEKMCDKMTVDMVQTLSSIDVSQRGMRLQEIAFLYSTWLDQQNLSLKEKQIAIDWYNAQTQKTLVDSQTELNSEQKAYLSEEKGRVKAVTETENALRENKVEEQKWKAQSVKRGYKLMPVEKTVGIVKDAAVAYGSIALGSSKLPKKNDKSESDVQPPVYSEYTPEDFGYPYSGGSR